MAKCKNCTKCLMGEVVFIHGARVYPFCGVDGEEIENLDEDKECIDFECMTNADRIRSMTDEELAELLESSYTNIDCVKCKEPVNSFGSCVGECKNEFLRWLKSEVGCE